MEMRPLGSTGLVVSVIGLGTVKLGRDQGVRYPGGARIPSDDEARELIHAAADLGITLIDTAPAYGTSEARLGALLAGQRDRWTIVTKVGEEFEGGVSRFDFSAAAVRASVERSLARLRTDRVECVLIHSDGVIENAPAIDDTIDELERLKARGLVQYFGASTKTVSGGLRSLDRCDVVMVTLNLAAKDDLSVIAEARKRSKGVFIKKALASGHAAVGGAGAGTAGLGLDPVGASLRFALNTPGVSSVIVGTSSPTHLAENCRVVGGV
ncbi:MAG: aldo/keto reductase [Phycisphaerae bacterium]|nr:aldo/keto reductase [Phycisphaerae bacterium]